jgi:hypothetical protein
MRHMQQKWIQRKAWNRPTDAFFNKIDCMAKYLQRLGKTNELKAASVSLVKSIEEVYVQPRDYSLSTTVHSAIATNNDITSHANDDPHHFEHRVARQFAANLHDTVNPSLYCQSTVIPVSEEPFSPNIHGSTEDSREYIGVRHLSRTDSGAGTSISRPQSRQRRNEPKANNMQDTRRGKDTLNAVLYELGGEKKNTDHVGTVRKPQIQMQTTRNLASLKKFYPPVEPQQVTSRCPLYVKLEHYHDRLSKIIDSIATMKATDEIKQCVLKYAEISIPDRLHHDPSIQERLNQLNSQVKNMQLPPWP